MAAGLALFTLLSRGRTTARETMWTLAAFAVVVVIAATYADVQALSTRLHDSLGEGLDSRLSIWRQTWPVVRDFWPVGSGAGTYEAVMVRYQTMSRFYYASHADNEGLQILAEGGLLLGIPAALTLASGVWLVAERLRADRTAIFWLRAGAAAGLLALVAQNMVEMTLRVPANEVMFALLAAVATYE
jgi:O-antigen ligase